MNTHERLQDVKPAGNARLDESENLDRGASSVKEADDGGGVVAVVVLPRHLKVVGMSRMPEEARRRLDRTFSSRVTMLKKGRSGTFAECADCAAEEDREVSFVNDR
jgi:hypothetical protein